MTIVGITGAAGFLGWHLRCRLRALRPEVYIRNADRAIFSDSNLLERFVAGCDAVVHLAGANRGSETTVAETNPSLANRLAEALDRTHSRPQIVYANSIQSQHDSTYGTSKRAASDALRDWGRRSAAPVADLVFPNLFGENGRPFYNSAVSTFCHQLSRGEPSELNPEGVTELLHAQDAAQVVMDAIENGANESRRIAGTRMSIPDLYERLLYLSEAYNGAQLPHLASILDKQLFNTLRSYRFPGNYPQKLLTHGDQRGIFFELARGEGQSQVSISSTRPGVTRGDHFHLEKVERFVVISGEAIIRVRRLFDQFVHEFRVSGETPVSVDMPTLHTHNITNCGESELLTAFWANDHFDPDRPDTYIQPVQAENGEA
jgi:UDP-2-acetamido-2,6-beta-L-arabino-hexul-4-ose reductase